MVHVDRLPGTTREERERSCAAGQLDGDRDGRRQRARDGVRRKLSKVSVTAFKSSYLSQSDCTVRDKHLWT